MLQKEVKVLQQEERVRANNRNPDIYCQELDSPLTHAGRQPRADVLPSGVRQTPLHCILREMGNTTTLPLLRAGGVNQH